MSEAIGPWVDDRQECGRHRGVCERHDANEVLRAWVSTQGNDGAIRWQVWAAEGFAALAEGTARTVDDARAAADTALGLRPTVAPRPDLLAALERACAAHDVGAAADAAQVLADWYEEATGTRGDWRIDAVLAQDGAQPTVYRDGVAVAGGAR